MAFKINKTILTDKGETNEAYVRFSRYDVQKNGDVTFFIEMFMSQREVLDAMPTPNNPNACKNAAIGDMIYIDMKKKVKILTKNKITTEVLVPEEKDADGNIIKLAHKTYKEEEVEEESEIAVPDMTPLTNGTIFAFAYDRLKEKLVSLYGEENIEEC